VNDSHHLLLEYFDMICDSPSQIYHLALPFSPPSSWLHNYYSASQKVRIVKGLPVEWDVCFRTVTLDDSPWTLACWKDTIAVGCHSGGITILDGITGSQTAVLSGHSYWVKSVAFSSDGTLLVSGGGDDTVKLWDLQTGGVIRTFRGHTSYINSVSISADCTMIASGSGNKIICLWDVQTNRCHHTIEQQSGVDYVSFSPMDSQCLISISDGRVWQWDINDHQINPTHDGSHVAFSLDLIQLTICQGVVTVVQHFDDRQLSGCCCLFHNGRLIAVASGRVIQIWDITSSDPHLTKTLVGHTSTISSLTFSSPSSLISSSYDKSVKFWQIDDLLMHPIVTDPNSASFASAPIKSITLQAKSGIAISSDSNGVVRIWDISTGHCKGSFQTPAKNPIYSDIQQIDSRLISVWSTEKKIQIWDVGKGELQITVEIDGVIDDVRISRDGSRIFCLCKNSLQVWSILTGEKISSIGMRYSFIKQSLIVDGSRVWVYSPAEKLQGWDFENPDSPPVQLTITPPFHLNGTRPWGVDVSRIKNTTTGKVVFCLGGRFTRPADLQWDGRYLVAGYESGEVLILDFYCVSI